MQVEVINVLINPDRTDLVRQFMELRRQTFVVDKKWDLNVFDGLEFEQYDHLQHAFYPLAIHHGRVVGGARLLRTDTVIGSRRQLIRPSGS